MSETPPVVNASPGLPLDSAVAPGFPAAPSGDLREDALALAKYCARICDWQKLDDVTVFDVRKTFQITDYFVISSGMNLRQIKSAYKLLDRELSRHNVKPQGVEGYADGKWILIDYGSVVVHLFLGENRRYYDLEMLWGDSPRVTL